MALQRQRSASLPAAMGSAFVGSPTTKTMKSLRRENQTMQTTTKLYLVTGASALVFAIGCTLITDVDRDKIGASSGSGGKSGASGGTPSTTGGAVGTTGGAQVTGGTGMVGGNGGVAGNMPGGAAGQAGIGQAGSGGAATGGTTTGGAASGGAAGASGAVGAGGNP